MNIARLVGSALNTLAMASPSLAGSMAFTLFGLPVRRKPRPEDLQFLATGKQHIENIGKHRIASYSWGDPAAPKVLLAHGWESHSGRWRKIIPQLLEAGYAVVAVDAPAHGRSSGRHFTMLKYAGVLGHLLASRGPFHTLIGHSVGGAASIWAIRHTENKNRPGKAVIMASFSSLETILSGTRMVTGASDRLMQAFADTILRKTGAPVEHYSLAKAAEQLTDVEGLIIHDRLDKVTAFRDGERLHEAWANSRFLPTSGYGHGLNAPEVWRETRQFLAGNVAV